MGRLIFILLIISPFVSAQYNPRQLSFQHTGEEEGLSNSIVNCIVKDKKGFMWIATYDGLNRYDGTHFITFRRNPKDTASIGENTIMSVCTGADNDIWCATATCISCFHQQTQQFENFYPGGKEAVFFRDIVYDSTGTIWCSSNNGLYEYLPAKKMFRHYGVNEDASASLSSKNISTRGMVLTPDNKSIWLATEKGINRFDIGSKKIFNYRNNPQKLKIFDSTICYPLAIDRKGRLVYFQGARGNNLISYNIEADSVTVLDILFSKKMGYKAPPNEVFIDNDNNYWISTWGYTLFRYNPATGQSQEFYNDISSSLSVKANFFWGAYQDKEGTVWLGTVNGLSYTNDGFTLYKVYQPLKAGHKNSKGSIIKRYTEDANGIIWFTCIGQNILFKYNPYNDSLQTFEWKESGYKKGDYIDLKNITCYKQYLLFATEKGPRGFNTLTGQFDDTPIADLKRYINGSNVLSMKLSGDTSLFIFSPDIGIVYYSFNSGIIKNIPVRVNEFLSKNSSGYANDEITKNGKWLILFRPLKLATYNAATNALDTITLQLDVGSGIVQALAVSLREDADKNIWICNGGLGLIRYTPSTNKCRLWQQSDGLVNNFVFANALDSYGRIWLGGYNKFSLFDPAKNKFENFVFPVITSNSAYVNRFFNMHDGNLLCNVDNMFLEWIPSKAKTQQTNLPVLINAVKVFDSAVKNINAANSIDLNYKENYFSIEFGIVTGLEKNRYHLQYKLEGLNDNWIEADALNTATYTNVPERDFVFKVRAVAEDGSWVGKETELNIKIIPPFYRTGWFRVLMALLFAVIVVALVRYRISSIRKTEEQKNGVNKKMNEWKLTALRSQMNPHFIFNCMNSIDMYILKNDAGNASRYLNKFARLVRLILNQSDETSIPLSKEIEMLKYYIELEMLRFDTPFTYVLNIDSTVDTEETEIPSMLLQPYVENAILHGLRHKKTQGHLCITINRNHNLLHCTIEDNGVGRAATAIINAGRNTKHESKGLKLTEERLEMININQNNKAIVNITDMQDKEGNVKGTRVEIDIVVEFDD